MNSPQAAKSPGSPQGHAIKVAVVGNPNTGKSTLFSALTGLHTPVGNYPGVTVEKKVGLLQSDALTVELIDLPGTYSLAPRSPDEMVSVEVLLGHQREIGPLDAVLAIVDASNLERNFYLLSQVREVGLPVVVALNMWDVAAERGIEIDVAGLQQRLQCPVVPVNARSRWNLPALRDALMGVTSQSPTTATSPLPAPLLAAVDQMEDWLKQTAAPTPTSSPQSTSTVHSIPKFVIQRALLDEGGYAETWLSAHTGLALAARLTAERATLRGSGLRIPAAESIARYAWARRTLSGLINAPARPLRTTSDRVDQWLTHRVTGLLAFTAIMLTVFFSIYRLAAPLQGACEDGVLALGEVVRTWIPAGAMQSLVVDGAIAGVGGVLVFVPQIALLFLFLSILEDCGYMPRAAFVMDKLMTGAGLSGRSFVPLMSSFACAIPGILATRTIEHRRDRLLTILVAPLMSCSARAPVYALMISAFVPDVTWWAVVSVPALVWFCMTFLGAALAIPIAWLFRRVLLPGETPPFVMELPGYKWPSLRLVLQSTWDRVWSFIARAGTLILAASIVIWGLSYFPSSHAQERELAAALAKTEAVLEVKPADAAALAEQEIQQQALAIESRRLLEESFLGRAGKVIEPVFMPLGWDWRIGVSVLASFPAREVVVATLGTIYSVGGETTEDDPRLQQALRSATWPDGRPVYNLAVSLSIMVFFALCAQCASTIMVIQRETGSWGWAWFTFGYMTTLAYAGAWLTATVTSALGGA